MIVQIKPWVDVIDAFQCDLLCEVYLDILGDRVGCLLGWDLHLGLGVLRDLIDEVVKSAIFQWDVVPRWDGLVAIFEDNTEVSGAGFAHCWTGHSSTGNNTVDEAINWDMIIWAQGNDQGWKLCK